MIRAYVIIGACLVVFWTVVVLAINAATGH